MKRPQAVKLWQELHDSTDKEEVYQKFDNKPGYGSRRTLMRFAQLDDGLRQGISLAELAVNTGWNEGYLSKISRWWHEEFGEYSPKVSGNGLETISAGFPATSASDNYRRILQHAAKLLAPLTNLAGVHPYPLHNPDLTHYYLRPAEPSWPVPGGRVWRLSDGTLAVHLRCEHHCQAGCEDDPEWLCLCQHLEHQPLPSAVAELKRVLSADIGDRLKLLGAIQKKAEATEEEGGTGLQLISDLSYGGDGSQPGFGPYFLFTALHQGMARALQLPLQPKREMEFRLQRSGIIDLGGVPVIRAPDAITRERAIDWLLRVQESVVPWPETRAAIESYRQAEAASRRVQRELRKLEIQAGLPEGSTCEVCRDWDRA